MASPGRPNDTMLSDYNGNKGKHADDINRDKLNSSRVNAVLRGLL